MKGLTGNITGEFYAGVHDYSKDAILLENC